MSAHLEMFYSTLLKGIVIAFLYFETTLENDTTFKNIFLFTFFYMVMIYAGMITGIESNVITGAFLTKTIFTLIDSRIKQQDKKDNKKDNKKNNNDDDADDGDDWVNDVTDIDIDDIDDIIDN
jgi:hypothetical protein